MFADWSKWLGSIIDVDWSNGLIQWSRCWLAAVFSSILGAVQVEACCNYRRSLVRRLNSICRCSIGQKAWFYSRCRSVITLNLYSRCWLIQMLSSILDADWSEGSINFSFLIVKRVLPQFSMLVVICKKAHYNFRCCLIKRLTPILDADWSAGYGPWQD